MFVMGTKLQVTPEPGVSIACGHQGCRTCASILPVAHKNTNVFKNFMAFLISGNERH